eukprot:scaffold446230_cov13-Prasinocladus_malaysianus.AAC.1
MLLDQPLSNTKHSLILGIVEHNPARLGPEMLAIIQTLSMEAKKRNVWLLRRFRCIIARQVNFSLYLMICMLRSLWSSSRTRKQAEQ